MNRVVREHYPVANLPEDLQAGFAGQPEVKITLEAQPARPSDEAAEPRGQFSRFRHLAQSNFDSIKDVVAHVREIRDEWDERDRMLHPEP